MDLLPVIATCTLAGASFGGVAMALFNGRRAMLHKRTIGSQAKLLTWRQEEINRLEKECGRLTDRCCHLRVANRNLTAETEGAKAEIARMAPLAERGQRSLDQQRRAASAGGIALAKKKRAARVTPICTRAKKRA